MSGMPSRATLQRAVGGVFQLQDDHGTVTEVELLAVAEGVHMASDYTCYAAVFGLPQGLAATQGTYRLTRAQDAWSLFLAPLQPDGAGRARLEAVFHYRRCGDELDG